MKVVYPKLQSQKPAKGIPRIQTENDLAVALQRSLSTSKAADGQKKKGKNPTVNREFFDRLRKLLKIMIPGLWTVEAGILTVHTISLAIRTFLSIYVAKLEGVKRCWFIHFCIIFIARFTFISVYWFWL